MENEISDINFASVFHGIRFKVRGLIVGMAINLFFYGNIPTINPVVVYLKFLQNFGAGMPINLFFLGQLLEE